MFCAVLPTYALLLSRGLENNFLEKDKERKLEELGAMKVNVIFMENFIKQKMKEIPIFIKPAESQDPFVKNIL